MAGRALQVLRRAPQRPANQLQVSVRLQPLHCAQNLIKIGGQRRALITQEFSADQIVGLNAVGAFIDRGNTRIPVVLGGARLFNESHAAMNLYTR